MVCDIGRRDGTLVLGNVGVDESVWVLPSESAQKEPHRGRTPLCGGYLVIMLRVGVSLFA